MTPEHGLQLPGPDLRRQGQEDEPDSVRRERDLLSAVLDTAGALVILLDREGRIVLFNRACEAASGYSSAEVSGQIFWDLFLVPDEVGPVRALFEQLSAGKFPNEHENHWLTKNGGHRLIAWSNTALLGPKGAVDYVIGTGIDITERRQAEEALRETHDELESRVAGRTAELQRATEFLAALHGTALDILSHLDLDELLEAIVTRTANLVAGISAIYLVDHDADALVARVISGPYSDFIGYRLKRGEGMCGKVWELDRPMRVDEYNTWDGRAATYPYSNPDPRVERSMGVPLHSGDQVVGVLGVSRTRSSAPFRQDEMDIALRLAQLASIALDNARLYSSVQQQLLELQQTQHALQQRLASEGLIARISTEFVNLGPSEVDTGIQHALQAIGEVAGVDRSYVFQFSGDGSLLDNTHEWCAEGITPYIGSLQGLPRVAFPWFVSQLERLEVVAVPHVADMPPEAAMERAECEREGIQSLVLVPLSYRGMLTGFLGFDSVRVQREWTEAPIALLKIAAGIIVNALEHKRAQAIQAGQSQFLELLATGGSFAETLHTLVRLIEAQWPGMLGLILLLDEDGKHLHVGASVSLPEDYVRSIEGLEIGPLVGSCGTACYRRERVIVEDTATDLRWEGLRALALRYGLRACWSEPVFSPSGQVVGTFAMYYRQPRAPTEAELRTIEMGAHLVGVAIEHNRAEQLLRESEEKFRGIIEYANIGIAIVQQARFQFLNPHWAAMLGYSVEEMVGTDFMRYCSPEERDRIVGYYLRRAKGEPAPARYETSMVHKNGSYVYAEVSVGIIPYGGQQATFVFLRDVTQERRAQEALQEAYQTLEDRVDERTKELAVLNSIAGVVSGSLDLREIMAAALDKTCEVLGMEFGTAYALEDGRHPVPPVRAANYSDSLLAEPETVAQVMQAPAGEVTETHHLRLLAHRGVSREYAEYVGNLDQPGSVAALARAGQPFAWLVQDTVPPDSKMRKVLEREECRQVVTLPLVAKGGLVGAINLGTRVPRAFEAEQLALLAAIGQEVGMAMENARLYEAEQSRRAEAEARRRVAEGLREVLAVLNSRRSLHEVLELIATQACRLLDGDAAAILRLEDRVLRIQAACGLAADYIAGMAIPLGEGGAGRALATHRPTIIGNLPEAARRTPPDTVKDLEVRNLLYGLVREFQALLSVPLVVQGQDYGALSVYYRNTRDFSDEDLRLAMGVADQAALAVESARLREQAAQAAAMEERGRLARELHDSVTQSLYSVTMYAEAAARLMPPGQGPAAEYLRDARDTAQEALREMRLMIYQLRPPILEQGGLAVALQVRLDAVERRGGIRAELIVEGEDRLPPAVQVELHQIAQEALNNTLKHAHAHAVQVHLHFGDDLTHLEIQDDGAGFDPAAARAGGGLGLAGMNERAQKIGARLNILSAPGQGTRVLVEVSSGGGE